MGCSGVRAVVEGDGEMSRERDNGGDAGEGLLCLLAKKRRPLERRVLLGGDQGALECGMQDGEMARLLASEWSTTHATWYNRCAKLRGLGAGCGIGCSGCAERCFADARRRVRAEAMFVCRAVSMRREASRTSSSCQQPGASGNAARKGGK